MTDEGDIYGYSRLHEGSRDNKDVGRGEGSHKEKGKARGSIWRQLLISRPSEPETIPKESIDVLFSDPLERRAFEELEEEIANIKEPQSDENMDKKPYNIYGIRGQNPYEKLRDNKDVGRGEGSDKQQPKEDQRKHFDEYLREQIHSTHNPFSLLEQETIPEESIKVDSDSLGTPASEETEEVIANIKEPQSDEISPTTNFEAAKDHFALFCFVFPPGYEFTKDMLIWQWVAEGLIKVERGDEEKKMEPQSDEISTAIISKAAKDHSQERPASEEREEVIANIMEPQSDESICLQCFKKLREEKFIVPSGYDYWLDQERYKFGGEMNDFLQKRQPQPKFRKYIDGEKIVEGEAEHLTLISKEIDHIEFDIFKQWSSLRTLILHQCYNSKFKCLPDDLFLKWNVITNLNLSYTDIEELPTSIKELTELRYLDVSHTPIIWLPESIGSLCHLLMFNLDGCDSLNALPRSTNKLVNLYHLILNATRNLELIPFEIGKLVKLRNLQTFLVGKEDGHLIVELKNLKELRGSLRILNLENVKDGKEANAACLQNKDKLTRIELQWSDLQDKKNTNEEQILESLKPHGGIQELKICFYSGTALPLWISDGSLEQLVSITFVGCRDCSSLPSLGALPSLKHLSIVENNEVVKINSSFCRQVGQNHVAFPKLEELSFDSMSKLEAWIEVEKGDFPLLQHITIKYCPEFDGLPLLSDLKSLKDMEIRSCPKLASLPVGGLPANLECLMINDCPNLNDKYVNKDCKELSEFAEKVALYFDYHQYSA